MLAVLTWVGLTPGGSPGPATPAATSSAPAPPSPVPLGSGVDVKWSGDVGQRALVPVRSLASVPGPPTSCDQQGYRDWLGRQNAVAAKTSLGAAVLRADRSASVTLLGLSVRIVSRRPITSGVYVRCGFGGGEDQPPQSWVDVDLDAPVPDVAVSDREGGERRDRILVTLRPGTPHVVFVNLRAAAATYEVSFSLIALVDNRRREIPLVPPTAPVTVTGVPAGQVPLQWDLWHSRWVETSD